MEQEEAKEADHLRTVPYMSIANSILDDVYQALCNAIQSNLEVIHSKTSLGQFVNGGLWELTKIGKACQTVCTEDITSVLVLKENDVDV